MTPALRGLAWFWAGVTVLAIGTGVTLRLGPSPKAVMAVPAATPMAAARAAAPVPGQIDPASRHGAIAAPDPALEEPAAGDVGSVLPRVGADGRTPMRAYAAASAAGDRRPRIAMLLTGIGLSASEDAAVADVLPAAVSFAVSPYAYRPEATLQRMRDRGHESFLSLPMEPRGFPADDPGPEALLTSNPENVNQRRLRWAMSRIAGYVGATNAMGTSRGERFAGSAAQMAPVLRELGSRGLMYIDGRPGAARTPGTVGRSADAVVDPAVASGPTDATETDVRLAQLEATAHDRGSALGVAGPSHPVLVARLASWAAALSAHGLNLVPVSAVGSAEPPTTQAATVTP